MRAEQPGWHQEPVHSGLIVDYRMTGLKCASGAKIPEGAPMSFVPACRGRGCTSTNLIKAHIIPQSSGRLIQDGSGANFKMTSEYITQKYPLGIFDTSILCERCDGFLNTRYDNPAYEFLSGFSFEPGETDKQLTVFAKTTPECNLLCGFILSVLWRASISS